MKKTAVKCPRWTGPMPDVKFGEMITFLSAVRLSHGFAAWRRQSRSQPVERTAAPAFPFHTGRQFGTAWRARPFVSAAVAHLSRSAALHA
jgi:hypothetical protein